MATPMINPLLHDLGVGKGVLAAAHMSVGLLLSLAGIGVGGWLLTKSLARALWFGWGVQAVALFGFAALAWHAANPWAAAGAWGMECFASSVTGMALVQVMSTRVIPGAVGASYAFLTCVYGLFGRMAGGGSGVAVAVISHTMPLHQAYALFFAATAAMGVPVAVVLFRYGGPSARQWSGWPDSYGDRAQEQHS